MINNQFNLFFDTELNEGVKVVTLSSVFFSDDDEAHSFIVRTTREGQPVSLEGATVRGYFIRPDNVTIELDGTVNEEGCVVVTLNEACYRKKGRFQLAIRSTLDDVISTVFCCDGGVKPSSSDSYVVDEPIVPSLSDILAKIEYMEEATAAANEAAKRANEAAENAGSAGGGTGGPVTWNQVTQKPSAFTPVAHSHTQSEVSGLTEALAGKADATHTHDYPVKSVNGMTGDVVIRTGGGGTGEGLPEVTVSDNGMPLVVKNGEWSVGKLQKNAVEGLITDIYGIYGLLSEKDAAIAEKADNDHTHVWSAIAGKPTTFPPETHTHDWPVKSVNGMTGDVVIQAGGTDERLPQVTEADNGMPLYVENGEYKVGKVQKNAVQGLVTDFINIYGLFDAKDAAIAEKADKVHTHAFSEITDKPSTFLTEADKQDIVNDTLSALAGADTSDAAIANLNGRVGLLERKATNIAEDIAALQYELDELETNIVYYVGTGWPILSPNGTLYAIRVNDDGSLYTGPFEPLT